MRLTPILLATALATAGCRGVGLFAAIAGTAIITAAIVSSRPPPPPRVVIVPEARAGYVWAPGYWTLQGEEWEWVDGQWLAIQPGYTWSPAHWIAQPDGTWRLVPGQWVAVGAPPPPPAEE